MAHFLYCGFLPFVGDNKQYLLDHLPSLKLHNTTTSVSQLLVKAIHQQEETNACEITQGDYDFIYTKVTAASYSLFFGSSTTTLLTTAQVLLFHMAVAICSISALAKLGLGLD